MFVIASSSKKTQVIDFKVKAVYIEIYLLVGSSDLSEIRSDPPLQKLKRARLFYIT